MMHRARLHQFQRHQGSHCGEVTVTRHESALRPQSNRNNQRIDETPWSNPISPAMGLHRSRTIKEVPSRRTLVCSISLRVPASSSIRIGSVNAMGASERSIEASSGQRPTPRSRSIQTDVSIRIMVGLPGWRSAFRGHREVRNRVEQLTCFALCGKVVSHHHPLHEFLV